jgi:hypothetical protein
MAFKTFTPSAPLPMSPLSAATPADPYPGSGLFFDVLFDSLDILYKLTASPLLNFFHCHSARSLA